MKRRKYRLEYAHELLRLADADLFAANAVFNAGGRVENACFYYQQAVEKALKSVLVHQEIEIPSVHDLSVLLALLPVTALPCPFEHELPELNIYAAQRRYEEGPTPATQSDGLEAQSMCNAVLNWAQNLVQTPKL